MDKTCFCGIAEHCGYQIETDMEQHDKVIYEHGYSDAVREFAERLKEISYYGYQSLEDYVEDSIECVAVEDIPKIVEQMLADMKKGK